MDSFLNFYDPNPASFRSPLRCLFKQIYVQRQIRNT